MRTQILPDTYSVPVRIVSQKPCTNSRYRHFCQTHFTAGDPEQFEQNLKQEIRKVPTNVVSTIPLWPKYAMTFEAIHNTFEYIFYKFKKGICIQIRNGQVVSFLPFSNAYFVNEWHSRVSVPAELEPSSTILPVQHWYANNGLIRFESPCNETDTGVCHMKNMFETLCAQYGTEIPDVDFFVNRRDFPLLKQDGTEPYHHLWDSEEQPLVSGSFSSYAPILSSCTREGFADLPIPTMEDWSRVQFQEKIHFASTKRVVGLDDGFPLPWNKKRELAVFRGSATGIGVDPSTNIRLKLVTEFQNHPYCNVGITSYSTRPRKIFGHPTIVFPESHWTSLSGPLTIEEQASYKYIIHVEGHVQAYRLSIELATRSVILLVQSKYKLWYEDLLVPWKHFVPVSGDLSDLDERIQWCLEHDRECQSIAQEARLFYETYLSRAGCLEHLKRVLCSIAQHPPTRNLPHSRRKLFTPYLRYGKIDGLRHQRCVFKNVNTAVHLMTDGHGCPYVFKQNLKGKGSRFEHEFVIGSQCINSLTQRIPNFVYTYGLVQNGIILEHVPGITLLDYIRSSSFCLNDWYFYMIQILLAINVAQRACFFTHHDLCPWNIMLMPVQREQVLDYLLGVNSIYRVFTYCIPVILDFDKAHAVVDLQTISHYFGYQPYQDALCLWISSLHNILRFQSLRADEKHQLLRICQEVIQDPIYCPSLRTFEDLELFLKQAHRYSHISFFPKGELLQRPVEFMVGALLRSFRPHFRARCEKVDTVQFRFLRGVRVDQVRAVCDTISQELHPILALHWKQWFHVFLDSSDEEDREPICDFRFSLPELPIENTYADQAIFLISPRILQHLNLLIDLYTDGSPFSLFPEERKILETSIENDLKAREKILAYSKHLTKIKLMRNIL